MRAQDRAGGTGGGEGEAERFGVWEAFEGWPCGGRGDAAEFEDLGVWLVGGENKGERGWVGLDG